MSAICCSHRKPNAGDRVRRPGARLRRAREIAGWLVPGTMLALLPKCPMCLAAYVALGTGLSLSYPSAHLLLRALTALCISTLAFCVVRRMMRYFRQKSPFPLQPISPSR